MASASPQHKGRLLEEEIDKAGAHREFASILTGFCACHVSWLFVPSFPQQLFISAPLSSWAFSLLLFASISCLPILHISFVYLHLPRKSQGNIIAFAAVLWSNSLGCISPLLPTACYCKGYGTGTVCCSLLLQWGTCPAAPIVMHRIGFYQYWCWISGFENVIRDSQLFLLFFLVVRRNSSPPIKDSVCCTASHTDQRQSPIPGLHGWKMCWKSHSLFAPDFGFSEEETADFDHFYVHTERAAQFNERPQRHPEIRHSCACLGAISTYICKAFGVVWSYVPSPPKGWAGPRGAEELGFMGAETDENSPGASCCQGWAVGTAHLTQGPRLLFQE